MATSDPINLTPTFFEMCVFIKYNSDRKMLTFECNWCADPDVVFASIDMRREFNIPTEGWVEKAAVHVRDKHPDEMSKYG